MMLFVFVALLFWLWKKEIADGLLILLVVKKERD